MRRILLFIATIALTLNSCGIAVTEQSQQMIVMSPTKPKSSPTAPPKPPTPTIVYDTKIPTLTLTPNPVIDSKGNITWHPKEILIAYEVGGGDGVGFDYPPEFVLLWDGTLLQPGSTQFGQPYISRLDQTEICKILKTIDSSGFFEEPRFYNFPFDGFGSQYITVFSPK